LLLLCENISTMTRLAFYLFTAFFFCIVQFSCSGDDELLIDPDLSERNCEIDMPSVIEGDNGFSFSLFKALEGFSTDEENLFISPLSASFALGMTYNGAASDTKTEIQSALGWLGLEDDVINGGHSCLIDYLEELDEQVILQIANSIWYREGFDVLQDFLDTNALYYDGEIVEADFSDPATLDAINDWCAEKTNDKILEVLDQIPGGAVMYLINAIYFKGDWKFEFDPEETEEKSFYGLDGSSSTVQMMKQQAEFNYLEGDNFQVIDLPYGDEKYTMTVFLPNVQEFENFQDDFTYANYKQWTAAMEEQELVLDLPRFKVEYKTLLNDPLKELGMNRAFGTDADLSNLVEGGGPYISRVIHQTFLEVNEAGSEAAAVTVVEIIETTSINGNGPTHFSVNRPFYLVIREVENNSILFVGKVMQPES